MRCDDGLLAVAAGHGPDEGAVAGADVVHDGGAALADDSGPHHERLADVNDVVALLLANWQRTSGAINVWFCIGWAKDMSWLVWGVC